MQRELLVRKEVSQDIQGHLNEHFKIFKVINEHQNISTISFKWFLLVPAVCEHLHPHLHRGVGRPVPAGHHRPCRHQRCGSLSQKGKSKHLSSGWGHPRRLSWSRNLHGRCRLGGSANCKVFFFFGASNLLEQPCIICCIICTRV